MVIMTKILEVPLPCSSRAEDTLIATRISSSVAPIIDVSPLPRGVIHTLTARMEKMNEDVLDQGRDRRLWKRSLSLITTLARLSRSQDPLLTTPLVLVVVSSSRFG